VRLQLFSACEATGVKRSDIDRRRHSQIQVTNDLSDGRRLKQSMSREACRIQESLDVARLADDAVVIGADLVQPSPARVNPNVQGATALAARSATHEGQPIIRAPITPPPITTTAAAPGIVWAIRPNQVDGLRLLPAFTLNVIPAARNRSTSTVPIAVAGVRTPPPLGSSSRARHIAASPSISDVAA
jgi:hypothetical protein